MRGVYRKKAPAKINLTLDVLYKRPDGYHELSTMMQGIQLADDIAIKICTDGQLTCKTNLPYLRGNVKNIASVAAERFFNVTGVQNPGLEIHIRKNIPVCAGLGGGSADAAAVLLLLNRIFHTNLPMPRLYEIGAAVGADVPFCLYQKTALCTGVGEKITPLPDFRADFIVLATPQIVVPTARIFQALDLSKITRHPDTDAAVRAIAAGDLAGLSGAMYNVLEEVTSALYPDIQAFKNVLLSCGAQCAMMSGSGPSVFGIFKEKAPAEKARRALLKKTKNVFLTRTYRAGNSTGTS